MVRITSWFELPNFILGNSHGVKLSWITVFHNIIYELQASLSEFPIKGAILYISSHQALIIRISQIFFSFPKIHKIFHHHYIHVYMYSCTRACVNNANMPHGKQNCNSNTQHNLCMEYHTTCKTEIMKMAQTCV